MADALKKTSQAAATEKPRKNNKKAKRTNKKVSVANALAAIGIQTSLLLGKFGY